MFCQLQEEVIHDWQSVVKSFVSLRTVARLGVECNTSRNPLDLVRGPYFEGVFPTVKWGATLTKFSGFTSLFAVRGQIRMKSRQHSNDPDLLYNIDRSIARIIRTNGFELMQDAWNLFHKFLYVHIFTRPRGNSSLTIFFVEVLPNCSPLVHAIRFLYDLTPSFMPTPVPPHSSPSLLVGLSDSVSPVVDLFDPQWSGSALPRRLVANIRSCLLFRRRWDIPRAIVCWREVASQCRGPKVAPQHLHDSNFSYKSQAHSQN